MAPRCVWLTVFTAVIFLLPAINGLTNRQFFDPQQMYQYLLFSGNAYCDMDTIQAWNCPGCAKASATFKPQQLIFNQSKNVFVYIGVDGVGTNDVQIIVTFRGTQMTEVQPYPGYGDTQVHKGFYEAYEAVQGDVRQYVANLVAAYPTARLVITGHSLGGALATLCATDLGLVYYPAHKNISLWTIESPRVGNAVAIFLYHSPYSYTYCIFEQNYVTLLEGLLAVSFRITHHYDIVPHLPPKDLPHFSFVHTAQEVWLTQVTA